MNQLRPVIPWIILLPLLFSCVAEKRHYRKGYYFASVKHKRKESGSRPPSEHQRPARPNFAAVPSDFKGKTEPSGVSASSAPPLLKTSPKPSSLHIQTCDTLVLKDGSKITAALKEIGYKDIRYKLCDFSDGPDYLVEKYRVQSIHYRNGKQETFVAEEPPPNQAYRPQTDTRKIYSSNENNTNAVLSLTFGILGFYPIPVLGSVLGIVFGLLARNEVLREPQRYSNEKTAKIGLAVSIASLLFWAILVVLFLIV